MKIKIAIILRSLETGGAERQAIQIANSLDHKVFDVKVFVFYKKNNDIYKNNNINFPIIYLNKKNRYDLVFFLYNLYNNIYSFKPDIVHSFLDSPNIFMAIIKLMGFKYSLIWGIRSSEIQIKKYNLSRKIGFYIENFLKYIPNHFICNSEAGKISILKRYFSPNKTVVIHNGIECNKFKYNQEYRFQMRNHFGFSENDFLIGMVARFDPKKDHLNFIEAAKILLKENSRYRFILISNDIDALNEIIKKEKLLKSFLVLPLQNNLEKIYNSLDINTLSSSFGEGFPNVLAEGICCGCISVSTNVGDSSLIINDERLVVNPSDPKSLSDVWLWVSNLNELEKINIRNKGKNYIANNFSNEIMIKKMTNFYTSMFDIK
ncbi:glycosyltransferase [Alphaproteobacteria bacterium]|nr:glycosyltransferase [Alphaproteobacteria bacterium]